MASDMLVFKQIGLAHIRHANARALGWSDFWKKIWAHVML